MQQQQDKKEVVKTEVNYETIVVSANSVYRGTGTYDNMALLSAVVKFCEKKVKDNERLGYWDELQEIREALIAITQRACTYGKPSTENWFNPFVLHCEQDAISRLLFLVKNQYMETPMLDPSTALRQYYKF